VKSHSSPVSTAPLPQTVVGVGAVANAAEVDAEAVDVIAVDTLSGISWNVILAEVGKFGKDIL